MNTICRKAFLALPGIAIALSSFGGCRTEGVLRGHMEQLADGRWVCCPGGNECLIGTARVEIDDAPGFDTIDR